MNAKSLLHATDAFQPRHIGPDREDLQHMLSTLGVETMDDLLREAIPESIRLADDLPLEAGISESAALAELAALASENQVWRSHIGMGYHDTLTPTVILRNIMENPGWYTQYTPYQAEISQGRLEALLNYQTLIADLTGLPLSNASLLDEATAAAEAVNMAWSTHRKRRPRVLVASECHPQTIAVVRTRAEPLGMQVDVVSQREMEPTDDTCAVLLQYPGTDGRLDDLAPLCDRARQAGALTLCATDLLALCLLRPPGEFGVDIVIGSSQRFGVPMGFGGPHAAFIATHETYARQMPGRIIGVSRDARGNAAYRLALQTREQHIRRDRATSNICTAQVLLAIMASMYAVYHGPTGLRAIAGRTHALARTLAAGARALGHTLPDAPFFDTLRITPAGLSTDAIRAAAEARRVNLRYFENGDVGIALDETCGLPDVQTLLTLLTPPSGTTPDADALADTTDAAVPPAFARQSDFLTHPVFSSYRSETEMLRYIHRLQSRDLSLTRSMIPLGSCTMKLNATSEMLPVTWPGFGKLHPFAPADQTRGYRRLFADLEGWLATITGFDAVSLQPNAGSQGEYAGLLAIRAYHLDHGATDRDVCLIPTSAHGTNPASAVIAGFRVVPVQCDSDGNIDLQDLRQRIDAHRDRLGALMITYPSTHGVFETTVREVCSLVHEAGGLVYMDGANMNAQVGLCSPGDIGADVCHLNLHKTFCIPHGGGGPGMGPIGVTAQLAPYLPSHPVLPMGGERSFGTISAAPWGSPSILPISWAYIRMMGGPGLRHATEVAIANANYMARRLDGHYDILYRGASGRVAHEFVIDCRPFKAAGVEVEDIAKRLMDFGYHAPTMSWPVPGTLMIEPTESESLAELDRFCDAMIAIRQEIRDIAEGRLDATDNPLRNAPHTAAMVSGTEWGHAYSREQAAWPLPWLRTDKFWPPVARVDNAWGDRNLMCTCPPMEAHVEDS